MCRENLSHCHIWQNSYIKSSVMFWAIERQIKEKKEGTFMRVEAKREELSKGPLHIILYVPINSEIPVDYI